MFRWVWTINSLGEGLLEEKMNVFQILIATAGQELPTPRQGPFPGVLGRAGDRRSSCPLTSDR